VSDKRTPILGIVYNRLRYVNENARLPEYLRAEMREALHDLAKLAHICTCLAPNGVRHAMHCALSRITDEPDANPKDANSKLPS
jgi:hypothetical protein